MGKCASLVLSVFLIFNISVSFANSSANPDPTPAYFEALEKTSSFHAEECLHALKIIGQFPYEETFVALIFRLEAEIQARTEHRGNQRVLYELYTQLAKITTKSLIPEVEALLERAQNNRGLRRRDAEILNDMEILTFEVSRSASRKKNELTSAYNSLGLELNLPSTTTQTSLRALSVDLSSPLSSVFANNRPLLLPVPKASPTETLSSVTQPPTYQQWRETMLKLMENGVSQISDADKRGVFARFFVIEQELRKRREVLEKSVIGQDPAVDSFIQMFREDLIFGREKPQVRVLMGPSGTGKETIAHSLVNAIHQDPEARSKHLFEITPVKTKEQLAVFIGSPTGYIGSNEFPPFYRFLIEHSGGKYLLKNRSEDDEDQRPSYYVEINPDYSPSKSKNEARPEEAVVYLKSFQSWSKQMKDHFLTSALNTGTFTIQNPNGGLASITVPVTFVISTTEGSSLVTSREMNGERFGDPLTYDQILEKWKRYESDPEALRREMIRTGGGKNISAQSEYQLGISEELLNIFKDNDLLLMHPLSPDNLKEIARVLLSRVEEKFAKSRINLGKINIRWSSGLIDFLQSYQYNAEYHASTLVDRVDNMVFRTLSEAIESGEIPPSPRSRSLLIDVEKSENGITQLVFTIDSSESNTPTRVVKKDIVRTSKDVKPDQLTDGEIQFWLELEDRLSKKVFGINHISHELAKLILPYQERKSLVQSSFDDPQSAMVMMFLGLSSTGKTETGKALAEELHGDKNAFTLLDFSQVQSVDDIKSKVLGSKNRNGEVVPSDFMKAYDRANGSLIVMMDEAPNAPKEALRSLYDIFREEEVSTFSDGVPRSMKNVIIILTGNAGESWYAGIPRHVPEIQQRAALENIHQKVLSRPWLRRKMLENFFTEALLNRIGEPNIFFFGPLSYTAVRQLTELKTDHVLSALKPKPGMRGWNLHFADKKSYTQYLDSVEKVAFILREQGGSIDHFKKGMIKNLRYFLLKEKVADNANIRISFDATAPKFVTVDDQQRQLLRLNLNVEGNPEPLVFDYLGKQFEEQISTPALDLLMTAYHEAGHEIARQVYFHGKVASNYISILPGVTEIDGHWVVYDGIAAHKKKVSYKVTRDVVIREIAGLNAGETAERMITKGMKNDNGKQNDYARATRLARTAILKWGLSERFGLAVGNEQTSVEEIIATLSEDKKRILETEVNSMLEEGQILAERALLNNDVLMMEMGTLLAEQGKLDAEDLAMLYQKFPIVSEQDEGFKRLKLNREARIKSSPVTGPFAELHPTIPLPIKIADPDVVAEEYRLRQLESYEYLYSPYSNSDDVNFNGGDGGSACNRLLVDAG